MMVQAVVNNRKQHRRLQVEKRSSRGHEGNSEGEGIECMSITDEARKWRIGRSTTYRGTNNHDREAKRMPEPKERGVGQYG